MLIGRHSKLWVDCITIFRYSNISRWNFIWRPMLERNDILNHKTMSLRNEGYHMMALKNLDVTMYTLWHIYLCFRALRHTMESCCLSFVCQLFSELLHHFVCRSHLYRSKSFKSTPLQILIDIVVSIIRYFCRICMNTYMY